MWLLAAAVLGVLAGREAADGGGRARAYVVNPVLFSLSRRIPAIAVVVATVALTAYGAVLVPQLRVQATVTTASPGPVAPVPALATVGRGDTWSRTFTADRHGPQRVLRGARGPLVVGPGGVVALEGSSGSELWRYRIQQPEGVTSLAAASPDGRFVVLLVFTFGDSAIDPAQTRMVVLDGATGSVRAALYLPGVAP
ncbi:MAG TPA: hypothetical protein VFP72_21240, partial [Kineosporiaceae bacterium]|nr:hypothetical protein [Kineosporiaceae bacterium]